MKAFEVNGIVDKDRRLRLDRPLPIAGPSRVRVLVLFPEDTDDIGEAEWLKVASKSEAFAFLKEEAEDIYQVRRKTSSFRARI